MVVEILQIFQGHPNNKSHRATIPNIISEKKFKNNIRFRKQ